MTLTLSHIPNPNPKLTLTLKLFIAIYCADQTCSQLAFPQAVLYTRKIKFKSDTWNCPSLI